MTDSATARRRGKPEASKRRRGPLPVVREPEDVFQRKIVDLARILRWRVFHAFDSRRSEPGFPDLVLVRKPRVIFAELKSATGTFTPDQVAWMLDLEFCPGVEAYRWRPADFAAIQAVLR